jgi:hypothetical protein
MDLVCIYMSQAVVGPMNDFAFYSGDFSSCSPLFVYNRNTRWGGYYHVPGRQISGDHEDDRKVCEALVHTVKPTSAWVFHPGEYLDPDKKFDPFTASNLVESDAGSLAAMLADVAVARATTFSVKETGKSWRSLLAYVREGKLLFDRDMDKAGPYGTVYCSKRGKLPPGCGMKNWRADTSQFALLASGARMAI